MNEYNKLFIHSVKRRYIQLDKKQALKTAAYDVFSKKGYKATAISEIAEQAGVAVVFFITTMTVKKLFF